jgi:hypothetical protein
MKLLSEMANEQDVEFLIENTKAGKKYFIEGRWASAESENKNGRRYSKPVMESALSKYHGEYITQNRALGELGHPQNPAINLDRASHIIQNLKMEGNNVVGRAKVMDTPMGIIAKNLIDEGVKLGVSTRGLGSLKSINGVNHVQSDFFISAIDIVSDPSGRDCWVNGISESVDYQMLDDGRIIQLVVDHAKHRINEEKAMRAWSELMEDFKKQKQ